MEIVETLKKGFTKPGKWLIPLLGIWILYACTMEDETSYQGTLSLELVSDTTLMKSQTKASGSSIWDLSDFSKTADYTVEILQGTTSVQKYDRYDKMPDEVSLKPGDYTLLVSKGKNEPAAFSSPYFEGKQDFSIVDGMTTPVTVTASMANSRVTVDFSDDFLETYKSYTLSFMTNKMKVPLVYELGSAMYFQSDAAGTKLTIAMQLVNVYGKEIEYNATTTIKPKQWAKLTIRTDEKGLNGVAIDVVLNDETKETVYVNIGIPDFMEKLKGAPYIGCEAFQWEDTNVNEGTDGSCCCDKNDCTASACVDITAGGKINQVLLTVTDDAQNALINQYDLANLTPEQAAELKEEYGFVMPEEGIKGKVSASIELKSIIASLPGKASGDSHYKLSLTVVDALPESKRTTKEVDIRVPEVGESSITWGTAFPDGGEFEYGAFTQGDQSVVIDVPTGIETATISIEGLGITKQDIKSLNIEGITIEESSTLKIQLKFTQDWFNSLSFGDGDSQAYTVTFDIVDKLGASVSGNTKSFAVKKPVFAWAEENSVDAFAKYACLKIQTNHPEKVSFYGNGQLIDPSSLVKLENPETPGVVTFVWKNLNPTNSYTISAKYNNDDKLVLETKEFTTEEAQLLGEIGKLENWTRQDVWKENGKETIFVTVEGYQTFTYLNNDGWTTNNEITAAKYSGTYSALYKSYPAVTPIQKNDGYAASITSVGYGKGSKYYNTGGVNVDARAAGKLILQRNINSRPHKISFFSEYNKNVSDSERWKINVVLKKGEDVVSSIEEEFDNSINNPLEFQYFESKVIPDQLVIEFISSTSETPALKGFTGSIDAWKGYVDSKYLGNTLIIDDVELIYDYE